MSMTNSYIFGKSEKKKIGGWLLKIDQLISGYGSVQILNGANMKVEKQSIVALLGGNGTGKSTILRAASGLIRSWKGTIEFNGEQIQNLPAHEIVGRDWCK